MVFTFCIDLDTEGLAHIRINSISSSAHNLSNSILATGARGGACTFAVDVCVFAQIESIG